MTRKGDFSLKMIEKRVKVPLPPCEAPGSEGRRCRLRGSKVRASRVEARGFISYYIIRYVERVCFVMKVENFLFLLKKVGEKFWRFEK